MSSYQSTYNHQNIISNLLKLIFYFSFFILVIVLLDSWFVIWFDLIFKYKLLILWLFEIETQRLAKSRSDIFKLDRFKCNLFISVFKHIFLIILFTESNGTLLLFANYNFNSFNCFWLSINFLRVLIPFLDRLKPFKFNDSFYNWI